MGTIAASPGKTSYALIVGIGHYRDPRIPKLQFTQSDADAFFRLLADPELSACSTDNVKLLVDEQATLFNIKNAISGWLFQNATPDSTVVVYFAGHGGLENDKLGMEKDGVSKYLLPWDADLDNLFASALSSMEFNALLNTIRAQRLVIFMDACYAGGVTRGARDIGLLENPYNKLAEGQGRLIIASAQPNQRSWEDAEIGHGIFTHHLLEAMKGKADNDNDGCVSVMDVFRYLQQTVPVTARRVARNVQEPLLCGDISKDIVLTINSARILELAKQRSEEERQRKEEIKRKRRRLFEVHDCGDLPLEAFRQALPLIEMTASEMNSEQARTAGFLEALLNDKISVKLYLDSVVPFEARNEPAAASAAASATVTLPAAPSGSASQRPASPPSPVSSSPATQPPMKFCVHCGTRIIAGNIYCIGCGHRYSFLK